MGRFSVLREVEKKGEGVGHILELSYSEKTKEERMKKKYEKRKESDS